MKRYKVHLCGDSPCPSDPAFIHRFYFGCVPADFSDRTGRSKTFKQTKGDDGRSYWNGGCDMHAAASRQARLAPSETTETKP